MFPNDSLETDSLQADSLFYDSTEIEENYDFIFSAADSVRLDSMAKDSTARIKYFRYDRKDKPYLSFREKKKSSFFASNQRIIRRVVELDSTGQYVIIREMVGQEKLRPYLTIPLDVYMEMKLASKKRESWERLAYKYEKKKDEDDLGQFITDITNIEIPLPSTSFLSIFGPPKISLKINGAVDIHGAWRNETTEGITTSRLGNTRNEPDFKQQVQINVNGTIGDKLTINADWNTERDFEYENQLKIKYQGYEDEIIQSIEAGNVSLQTTPLIGGSEALFGIKANMQMGPFKLTALASQKKGETEEVAVTGGSTKKEFSIRAYNYSPNHFFVHEEYLSEGLNIFENYFNQIQTTRNQEYLISDIEVWITSPNRNQEIIEKGRPVNAFVNLAQRPPGGYSADLRDTTQTPIIGQSVINRKFIKLEPGLDYVMNDHNYATGFISFKTAINEKDIIAVAYRRQGQNISSATDDVFVGDFAVEAQSDTSVLVLTLVKPENLKPEYEDAWKLQLRNIYKLNAINVKQEEFKLDIFYESPGQEPTNDFQGINLLEAFGLDKTDASGAVGQDGEFDFKPNKTIFPGTGEIIFPVLEPFGDDFPAALSEFRDSLVYNTIYDTTMSVASDDKTKDRFVVNGEYTADVTADYQLGFNVVENSVKVLLNGNELTEGIDYSVDYNIGQVIIRNSSALVPGADLRITYEKNDLFSLASKTLLGFRGLFDFSENFQLGFSYLSLNQQTLSDKVRIGEEPLNNVIMGADLKTNIELPFITNTLSNVISTNTMSNFRFQGEYAYMSPDPNTKKSPIPSDGGKSIAYIDDFEGAKKIIPVGVQFRSWKDISSPDSMNYIGDLDPDQRMDYKAKSFWYNVSPSDVVIQDLFGDRRQAARDAQQVTALDFVFRPDTRGTYNRGNRFSSANDPKQNWGGMMTVLSSTANNLTEEKIEFLEFWMKVIDSSPGDKIHIDLGRISEDVIPNNKLDTEDQKNINNLLDEGEDLGLDYQSDGEETDYDNTDSDRAGDNFFSQGFNTTDPEAFVNVNGTQGNAALFDGGGSFPDTEDLNGNFDIDRFNSYFRYEVSLDTLNNPFIQGGGDNAGWYLFRVPLNDSTTGIGNPQFSEVETIRIWIQDVEEQVHFRLAEFNLVGNQWEKIYTDNTIKPLEDDTLTVSTINFEDNPEYIKPPGVIQERDRTVTDQEVFENEQSLQLILNNLVDGQSRETIKNLFRPLDLFNYKELKLYIRGDQDDSDGQVSYFNNFEDFGSEVYIRFGADTANYYEYRQPVTRGLPQNDGWEEIKIVFEELTAIKQALEDTVLTEFRDSVSGKPGHFYGVKGNPSLTRVNFFLIGVVNPKNIGPETVSGEIWVNELRVLGADDSPGWAFSGNTSLNLADLLTVNFNLNQQNPFFHKLADRFGSRIDNQTYGLSVDFNLLKLIPFNLSGSNLKIRYSRNESIQKPLYLPGTDVNVEQAAALLQEREAAKDTVTTEQAAKIAEKFISDTYTLTKSETWSATGIRLKIPSKAWYIEDIINSLTFGFTYNVQTGRSPTIKDRRNWIWNASANYNLNFGKENYIKPVDIPLIGDLIGIFDDYKDVKLYFTPQNFTAAMTAKRSRNKTENRLGGIIRISRDFTTTRTSSFNWILSQGGLLNLTLNYNLAVSNSLAHVLIDSTLDVNGIFIDRDDSDIWDDIFTGEGFGKPFNYTQNFDLKVTPKLPSIWGIDRYLRLSASYGVKYDWANRFEQENLGRSAAYANRLGLDVNFKLKSLMAPLFQDDAKPSGSSSRSSRGRSGRSSRRQPTNTVDVDKALEDEKPDSTNVEEDDGESPITQSLMILKGAAKWLFFDYEQITLRFNQTNSAAAGALAGQGTGFSNFWGFQFNEDSGPSRTYMLGLDNDVGPRVPGADFSDNFSRKNSLNFGTQRPLWDGASITLDWRVDWGFNKTVNLTTADLLENTLNPAITSTTTTGTIDRSFLSLPQVFFLPFNKAGISRVAEIYQQDTVQTNQTLSKAFVEGFESVPILSEIPGFSDIMKFIPRPNWSINWGGIEKLPLFDNLFERASLTHVYKSNYSEGWKINPDNQEEVVSQRVLYGFSPLIGLNVTFARLWGGNLTSRVNFSTGTTYQLNVESRSITESLTKEISFNASYAKKGFELPLFGLSLKNDIEISLSFSNSETSSIRFDFANISANDDFNTDGTPLDGNIRTTIEPRIRYVMSSRVTLALFYRRVQSEPKGASRIPPTTTNEAGLDVHISIQ